jgi:catechol 2,3-dioxygenase-like lactoylglutathione lyase family enzyme
MKLRTLLAILIIISVFCAIPALGELAAPNANGVTMGHVHLYTKDVASQTHFWVDIMGGKAVKNEKISLIEFPGVFIMLNPTAPTAPPAGSIVDHFGIVVKDLPGFIAKWNAAGLKVVQTGTNPDQRYVTAPEDIRVEVFGDPNLAHPVEMNHIHFFPPKDDIPAMQQWYAKAFGGVIGRRDSVARPNVGAWIQTVDLPGVNLSIGASDTRRAPTKGRGIEHIGFDVKDLDAFVKHLESVGIKLDEPIRSVPASSRLKITFITDPWGTRIELTEGLAPKL